MRYGRVAILIAVAGLVAGCAHVPSWVEEAPPNTDVIYAVGTCPRTHFEQDARENAKIHARTELAKTLKVSVKGVLMDWQSSSGGSLGGRTDDFIATVSEETVDVAMTGSQIVSVWCDREGVASEPGTWWALAKLDKNSLANETTKEVSARLSKKKGMTAEEQANIEEQARKAFEELDKRLQEGN